MEAIIFIGIQASGKSTFYKKNFFNSHIRISLDLLNTKNKQRIFLETCFLTHSRFVVDNTNPKKEDRASFIQKAKENKYKVTGYYFSTTPKEAILRNSKRVGKENIPVPGIYGTYKKMVIPSYEEGFDELYKVTIKDDQFLIAEIE